MNISTLLRRTLILVVFTFTPFAWGTKTYFIPGFCDPEDLRLKIQNTSAEVRTFWLQQRFDETVLETPFEVEPGKALVINGSAVLSASESLALKTHDEASLQFQLKCQGFTDPLLTDTATPNIVHYLPRNAVTVKVSLLNLHIRSQKVGLIFKNSTGVTLETVEVDLENYYDTINKKIPVPTGASKVEVMGSDRLHSYLFAQTNFTEVFSPAVVLAPFNFETSPSTGAYFLVSTKDSSSSESFVVHMTDSKLIEKAQEQIAGVGFQKIVVGRIQVGNGGFNRSFHRQDRAPYTWSVSHIDALADFAYIDCDGSPDLVEERLHQRLAEGGRICFWRYRIVKRLTAEQVRTGKL